MLAVTLIGDNSSNIKCVAESMRRIPPQPEGGLDEAGGGSDLRVLRCVEVSAFARAPEPRTLRPRTRSRVPSLNHSDSAVRNSANNEPRTSECHVCVVIIHTLGVASPCSLGPRSSCSNRRPLPQGALKVLAVLARLNRSADSETRASDTAEPPRMCCCGRSKRSVACCRCPPAPRLGECPQRAPQAHSARAAARRGPDGERC
mmetsp:Transcript_149687/g.480614  ORF Transcript_149687/g.480614 Transcript_149687/m.480614 type:complete len:203 (+) Transcript_149687:323-931(+)